MLNSILSYTTCCYDSYNTLLPQNLVSSEKSEQDYWMIIEARLIVAEFDLSGLTKVLIVKELNISSATLGQFLQCEFSFQKKSFNLV